MTTSNFKTNIKCGGCIATVTPFLNAIPEIKKWEVNTADANKILTVEYDLIDASKIIEAVTKAGYEISEIKGLP